MKAGELCNREVVTASRGTTVMEAARMMRDHHVGSLVIVEMQDGLTKPVGIITDRDLVIEILAENIDIDSVTLGDVMSFALLKISEQESVFDTAQRMRARGVRRVPVISETGALVGILALDDMLELLSEELSLLARLTSRESEQEQKKRTSHGG
jgi:CBS domain-containing protein